MRITPEDFIQKYASFEFAQWKKDHPDQLKILCRAMNDYGASLLSSVRADTMDDYVLKRQSEMMDEIAKIGWNYEPKLKDTPYGILMDARAKLMYIAANSGNTDVQQSANIAWQKITDVSFIVKNAGNGSWIRIEKGLPDDCDDDDLFLVMNLETGKTSDSVVYPGSEMKVVKQIRLLREFTHYTKLPKNPL